MFFLFICFLFSFSSDDNLSEDDINECEKEDPLHRDDDVPHPDYVSKKKRKKMDISVRWEGWAESSQSRQSRRAQFYQDRGNETKSGFPAFSETGFCESFIIFIACKHHSFFVLFYFIFLEKNLLNTEYWPEFLDLGFGTSHGFADDLKISKMLIFLILFWYQILSHVITCKLGSWHGQGNVVKSWSRAMNYRHDITLEWFQVKDIKHLITYTLMNGQWPIRNQSNPNNEQMRHFYNMLWLNADSNTEMPPGFPIMTWDHAVNIKPQFSHFALNDWIKKQNFIPKILDVHFISRCSVAFCNSLTRHVHHFSLFNNFLHICIDCTMLSLIKVKKEKSFHNKRRSC